jgi:DNA polymerase II large subunit
VSRARALLRHVRPNLVLSAAHLDDGHAADLLRELRTMALIEDVPLAVLGALTPQAEQELVSAPHVYVRKRDDGDTVITLLDGLLATARGPNPYRGLLDKG